MTQQHTPSAACDFVVTKSADHNIAVGPLVWRASDGLSARLHYFVVCSNDDDDGFCCDQIFVEDEGDRAAFISELMTRRGIIICLFNSELEMARWCEAIWPCEKITQIRKGLQAEQGVAF